MLFRQMSISKRCESQLRLGLELGLQRNSRRGPGFSNEMRRPFVANIHCSWVDRVLLEPVVGYVVLQDAFSIGPV